MNLTLGKTWGKAGLGAGLLATLALTAMPAEARHRYGRHSGNDAAVAITAGVVGLALGAALASNSRGRYYDDRYYDGYYYPRYRSSYNYPRSYYAYPQYRTYYYDAYPRYRAYDRYARKHRKWHRRHDRWGG